MRAPSWCPRARRGRGRRCRRRSRRHGRRAARRRRRSRRLRPARRMTCTRRRCATPPTCSGYCGQQRALEGGHVARARCSRSAASDRALRRSTWVRPASPSASSDRTPSAIQIDGGHRVRRRSRWCGWPRTGEPSSLVAASSVRAVRRRPRAPGRGGAAAAGVVPAAQPERRLPAGRGRCCRDRCPPGRFVRRVRRPRVPAVTGSAARRCPRRSFRRRWPSRFAGAAPAAARAAAAARTAASRLVHHPAVPRPCTGATGELCTTSSTGAGERLVHHVVHHALHRVPGQDVADGAVLQWQLDRHLDRIGHAGEPGACSSAQPPQGGRRAATIEGAGRGAAESPAGPGIRKLHSVHSASTLRRSASSGAVRSWTTSRELPDAGKHGRASRL